MLEINLAEKELFNEATSEVYTVKGKHLVLEHSLVSVSKWESLWEKPFLAKGEKTRAETISYIKFMTITQNVDPNIYVLFEDELIEAVSKYIAKPMSATTIKEHNVTNNSIITSEIIFYWMIQMNIPFECQKWNLNRLLMLIRVCDIKSRKTKNMTRAEIFARNKELNAERRRLLNSTG